MRMRDDVKPTAPHVARENRSLRQCTLHVLPLHVPLHFQHRTQKRRRRHQTVEQERAVHEQREPEHLQQAHRPHERLPAQSEANEPDAQRAACIGEAARRRAHVARHAEAKKS